MVFILSLMLCNTFLKRKYFHQDVSDIWSTYFPSSSMPSVTSGPINDFSTTVASASKYFLYFCEFKNIDNNTATVTGADITMLVSDTMFYYCSYPITSNSKRHIYGGILSFNGNQSSKFQQVRVCASDCKFALLDPYLAITNVNTYYSDSNLSNSYFKDTFSYCKLQYGHFESIVSEESANSELSSLYGCGDFRLGLGTIYMRTHNSLFQQNNITHCGSRYYAGFYLRGYIDDANISHLSTKYNQLDNLYVGDVYVFILQWTDATMEYTNIHDCFDINNFFGTLSTSSAPLTVKKCSFINLTRGNASNFKFVNSSCPLTFIDTYYDGSDVRKFVNSINFAVALCDKGSIYYREEPVEEKPVVQSNMKFERQIYGLLYLSLPLMF